MAVVRRSLLRCTGRERLLVVAAVGRSPQEVAAEGAARAAQAGGARVRLM